MTVKYKVLLPDTKEVQQIMFLAHGFGANAEDLMDLAPFFQRQFPNMAFISPNAPLQIFQNGFAWFDLGDFSGPTFTQENYLQQLTLDAQKPAEDYLDFITHIAQKFNVPFSEIILTGFSQGSLISLYTSLLCPQSPKAVIAFSAVPLLTDGFNKKYNFPVLLTHGKEDPVIHPQAVQITVNQLQQLGLSPQIFWQEHMGHAINEACLKESVSFLKKI